MLVSLIQRIYGGITRKLSSSKQHRFLHIDLLLSRADKAPSKPMQPVYL
jgi:hypothetical protein